MDNNNQVTVSGKVISAFSFSHESYGEKFYSFHVAVLRKSGMPDIIPIIVSEHLIDITKDYSEEYIQINGQFRSYNQHDGDSVRLILSVFAESVEFGSPNDEDRNVVCLDGYICKSPSYRKTPLGREISDILIAVNRHCGKSDYIPCVSWGRNAKYASTLNVGSRIQIVGRIQSREYVKVLDGKEVTRTAYEVSVMNLEQME